MAEFCAGCGKKIGFWEGEWSYIAPNKPLCHECAQPIMGCFDLLYDGSAEELAVAEENLREICRNKFEPDVAELIMNRYNERRKERGLLTKDEEETIALEKDYMDERVNSLIITTTPDLAGYRIEKYIDVVCEEIIFKNSLAKRFDALMEDVGNAFSLSQSEMTGASELIDKARKYAIDKFKRKAIKLGANAVVGVEFESSFGTDVVRVGVFGTAVVVSDNRIFEE